MPNAAAFSFLVLTLLVALVCKEAPAVKWRRGFSHLMGGRGRLGALGLGGFGVARLPHKLPKQQQQQQQQQQQHPVLGRRISLSHFPLSAPRHPASVVVGTGKKV